MKKHLIFSIFFSLLSGLSFGEQLRINNNPDMDPDFTTLISAIDNCSPGDTLYLEGSPTSYVADTIKKKVTIIGTGYLLSENPKTQAYGYGSVINGDVVFGIGSDGSLITGCRIDGYIYIGANSISIQRNYLSTIRNFQNIENAMITQNYITGGVVNYSGPSIKKSVISNNIIRSYIALGSNNEINQILNNIVIGYGNPASSISCYNSTVHNNINTNTASSIAINSGNTISYNILASGDIGVAGNTYDVDMASVFVDYDGTLGYSTDGKWQLKTGSPASGTGLGGVDCGVFDGIEPYILSGLPNVPHIYEVIMPGTVISDEDLSVTIKVKSGE